uniref:Uncharacterized protein n=1 Tax=Rhizophora mucronata TaxID=61149 RepID=A0A2P2NFV8_RHIMU
MRSIFSFRFALSIFDISLFLNFDRSAVTLMLWSASF